MLAALGQQPCAEPCSKRVWRMTVSQLQTELTYVGFPFCLQSNRRGAPGFAPQLSALTCDSLPFHGAPNKLESPYSPLVAHICLLLANGGPRGSTGYWQLTTDNWMLATAPVHSGNSGYVRNVALSIFHDSTRYGTVFMKLARPASSHRCGTRRPAERRNRPAQRRRQRWLPLLLVHSQG